MITLTGILRQAGEVTIKERPMVKLVIEHETARDNGNNDLHLETMFLDKEHVSGLPGHTGETISVEVRPYPSGRGVAFAAIRVVPGRAAALTPKA